MPNYLTKRKQITAARTWQLRKVTLFSNASERDKTEKLVYLLHNNGYFGF